MAAVDTDTETETSLIWEGKSYKNFINAIKSPATKLVYRNSLRRYLNYRKITNVEDLLIDAVSPRIIESQIVDYIMSLREDGLAYATIQGVVAPILTFYALNDVVLNNRKITRYYGEYKRIVKDRAYTAEEIHRALQTADLRMKAIILLMTSTAERIGSLCDLTLGNITKIEDYGIYKVTVYEGTNNEYYSFTTRECAAALDDYIRYRQRCSEKISFNNETGKWEPSWVPLIRQQFDEDDVLKARQVKPLNTPALRRVLTSHLVRCDLRTMEHPTGDNPNMIKRCRKSIALGNGFRKFAISSFI